jgi:hypothetical protein
VQMYLSYLPIFFPFCNIFLIHAEDNKGIEVRFRVFTGVYITPSSCFKSIPFHGLNITG